MTFKAWICDLLTLSNEYLNSNHSATNNLFLVYYVLAESSICTTYPIENVNFARKWAFFLFPLHASVKLISVLIIYYTLYNIFIIIILLT